MSQSTFPRLAPLFWATLAATALLLFAAPAHADSLDESLAELFAEGGGRAHPSVDLLERVGASYDGYAFAERLPRSGAYLVETRLRWRDRWMRFPLKARPVGDGWKIDWTPEHGYARALVELLDSDQLVALDPSDAPTWSDQTRMPALPVILDKRTATTPFGQVPLVDRPDLQASKGLGRHVGKWVDRILEGDPAPAALDVLAHAKTNWDRLSRVLLTAAGAGFFRLHLITRADDRLAALPALAPVFESGAQPSRANSLIVAMSADSTDRFRISVGGQLLEPAGDCDDDWSLCLEHDRPFGSQLANRLQTAFPDGPPSVSHVMFAAEGPTPIGEALDRAVDLPSALGIPPRKLYLGHTRQ